MPWYKKPATIVAAVITAIALITVMVWPREEEPSPEPVTAHKETVEQPGVKQLRFATTYDKEENYSTDLSVKSSIGQYSYTGLTDNDGKPHGSGTATFSDGRRYVGSFVHGVMEDTGATFVMSNGDIFTGEFRNDRFYKGRYTIKSDGSYFEGTFKNGQPDAGAWYDKNGNRL